MGPKRKTLSTEGAKGVPPLQEEGVILDQAKHVCARERI